MNEIKEKIDDLVRNFGNDAEIEDKGIMSNYLSLITDNLRENNKRISRNSFWMILSLLLYFLIFTKSEVIAEFKLPFTTIKDHNLLLNAVPVFFSFIYFKNIALWNHNTNLNIIFTKLSKELYQIGHKSDTALVIKPFSIILHVSLYQLANNKVKSLIKAPIILVLILFFIFPILFEFYSIYQIAINNEPKIIPIVCVVLDVTLE